MWIYYLFSYDNWWNKQIIVVVVFLFIKYVDISLNFINWESQKKRLTHSIRMHFESLPWPRHTFSRGWNARIRFFSEVCIYLVLALGKQLLLMCENAVIDIDFASKLDSKHSSYNLHWMIKIDVKKVKIDSNSLGWIINNYFMR